MRYVVLFLLTLTMCVGLYFGNDFLFKKCGPSPVQAITVSMEGLALQDLESLSWNIQKNGKPVTAKKFDQNYSQGSDLHIRRFIHPELNEPGTWDVSVGSGPTEIARRQFHVQAAGDGCTPITQTWDLSCQKSGNSVACNAS